MIVFCKEDTWNVPQTIGVSMLIFMSNLAGAQKHRCASEHEYGVEAKPTLKVPESEQEGLHDVSLKVACTL